MRNPRIRITGAVLAAGLGGSLLPVAMASSAPAAVPAVPAAAASASSEATPSDDLPNPLEQKARALRQEALTAVLNGTAKVEQRAGSSVVNLGPAASSATAKNGKVVGKAKNRDRYVELSRESTDRIFVVLAEFGDKRHPDYPDKDINPATPGPVTYDGPLRNAIPEPDRSVDNSTVWQPDYDQAHFQEIYFGTGANPGAGTQTESVKQYYQRQSSGRYSVSGTVTNWVKVKYNEARYGRSTDVNDVDPVVCAAVVCSNSQNLVQDGLNQWYRDQIAQGRTRAQVVAELKTFDVRDRYDFDGDGNFNEPDGYLDHFQVVHAGGDEADGDPQQGEDAIWSHRSYAFSQGVGNSGPSTNLLGGTQVGNSGIWAGDYTMQPENGGVSVFTHEYGHDLGLPDLYDTAGGQNGVDFWSLMAQSRLSGPDDVGLGTRAGDLGAWEKLQLGWLDYDVVLPSKAGRTIDLGPHEYNSPKAQAVVVPLPKKELTTALVDPFAGERSWWSGKGDDLDNTMSREVTLPAGAPASLTMQANWDIEDCGPDACDYAYVQVNTGSGWAAIPGSITTAAEGNGIDGTSDGWVPASFDLSAYAGSTIGLRLRYATDPAAGGLGFFADDIAVTSGSTTLVTSGAEDGTEGWTLDGFSAAEGSFTDLYDNYYIASHRDYASFDKYLKSGPYNFGFGPERPDFVEHFPLQDGLLVSYWDTSFTDNNSSQHPGEGLILPIDAHPQPIVRLDGGYWRERIAGYDATFGLEKADSFTLHVNGEPSYIRGQAAEQQFNDGKKYWYAETPFISVKVPNNGVNIRVNSQDGTSMKVRVSLR